MSVQFEWALALEVLSEWEGNDITWTKIFNLRKIQTHEFRFSTDTRLLCIRGLFRSF